MQLDLPCVELLEHHCQTLLRKMYSPAAPGPVHLMVAEDIQQKEVLLSMMDLCVIKKDPVKLDFMKNSHRRIPAAQTAGPMYGVLIYDNNQTQSGV